MGAITRAYLRVFLYSGEGSMLSDELPKLEALGAGEEQWGVTVHGMPYGT